jgi:hypothetical protein
MQLSDQEARFIHLVRLAWDLRVMHVASSVALPTGEEPTLLINTATRSLKVRAAQKKGTWFFTWGRGSGQRVEALDEEAAQLIQEAVQR